MAKLAFIMAASHSGSTLLAMLLGAHPQATTIGDTAGTPDRNNPDYRCSCGHRARECPFWIQITERMASQGMNIDVTSFGTRFEYPENRFINRVLGAEHRGPFLETVRDGILALSPGWKQSFQRIAQHNFAIVEAATQITNAKVLVDSSKLPHRLKFLLRIPGMNIRVVHLVRDGRGVAHTYIHDNGWSVEKAAIEWRRGIVAAEKLLSRLDSGMWKQVRYEDLCANPQAELQKLCVIKDVEESPFFNIFTNISLKLLTFDDGKRLLSSIIGDEEKSDYIVKWCGPAPYALKIVAEKLAEEDVDILSDDYMEKTALPEITGYFEDILSVLPPEALKALKKIAKDKQPDHKEIHFLHPLEKQGFLIQENDTLRCISPAFSAFLKKNLSADMLKGSGSKV